MNLEKLLHAITKAKGFDFEETPTTYIIKLQDCLLAAEINKYSGATEYFAGEYSSEGCQYFAEEEFNKLRDLVAFLKSEAEQ